MSEKLNEKVETSQYLPSRILSIIAFLGVILVLIISAPRKSVKRITRNLELWQTSYDSTITNIKTNNDYLLSEIDDAMKKIGSVDKTVSNVEKTARKTSQIQGQKINKLENDSKKTQKRVKNLEKNLTNNKRSLLAMKKDLLDSIGVLEKKLAKVEKGSKRRDLVLDNRLTGTTRRVNDIDETFFEMTAKSEKDKSWKKNYDKYLKTQNQSLWDSVAANIKKKLKNPKNNFSLITIK